MRTNVIFVMVIVFSMATVRAQRKPVLGGPLPDPGPNRIEVRFALGDKTLKCDHFYLTAKHDGQIIIDREFSSGFYIPDEAAKLPRKDVLELEIKCGKHRWHFSEVPERAFLSGWWWVGTDYPPFQAEFQGPKFKDAVWIKYLIADPTDDSGFDVYQVCPAKLRNKKPGPCCY